MLKGVAIICLFGLGIGATLLAASGCNILGPAGYFIMGPEKIPAAHQLDSKRKTVVFIDDRGSKVPERSLRRLIWQTVEQKLLDEKAVAEMISGDSVANALARERYGKPMSITEIGEAVGAEVVIYVKVTEFTLSPDRVSFQPRAVGEVKVMDVVSKARLWPGDDMGGAVLLTAELPGRQGTAPTSGGELSAANRELAGKFGTRIAQLFYKHDVNPIGGGLGRESAP